MHYIHDWPIEAPSNLLSGCQWADWLLMSGMKAPELCYHGWLSDNMDHSLSCQTTDICERGELVSIMLSYHSPELTPYSSPH